jgi:hypothetical protein
MAKPDFSKSDPKEVMEYIAKEFYGTEFTKEGDPIPATEEDVLKRAVPSKLGEFDQDVIIYNPSQNSDAWLTIGSESYTPDKQDFVVEKFKKDFQNIKGIDDIQQIGALASRSPKLSEWLNKTNLEYSLNAEVPLWAQDLIEPKTLKNLTKNIAESNKIEADRSQELNKLASKYKDEVSKINKAYDDKKDKVTNHDLLLAFTCNATTLPLSIQQAIENYSPADSNAPNKKTYARELLLQWRQQLLMRKLRDPNFKVSEFINSQALK